MAFEIYEQTDRRADRNTLYTCWGEVITIHVQLHVCYEVQIHTCGFNHVGMSLCVDFIVFNVLHGPAEYLYNLFDSRAHTIVTVAFTQNRRRENTSMQSTINLVDLAGRS